MRSAKTPSNRDGATHWKRRQTTEIKVSNRAPARLSCSTDHAPNLMMAPVIPYPDQRDDGSACDVMAHHRHKDQISDPKRSSAELAIEAFHLRGADPTMEEVDPDRGIDAVAS